ncbi:MAG: TRAP transporter small permease subunit [Gammaproteobacteria bacterium]|jgi:TRAP-type mannitol/chloroaromatic compound transport system permease small subunit|nr:TRAP transporter small permease subunit [Gammaproteobacteria bacterium]MDP6733452.1 TRAP transporter small permease subunit [Gammaproteobacteria bacterium]|tara:strand:+ start:7335 stop:7838 length:504 start_codon:yes stop_codon:yes gene_type:complete
MQRVIDLIDNIIEHIGRTTSWLTLAMVLLVVVIVTLRYVFQVGSIALQESVMYVNALIFTLGAAYTLKEQGHVRVDIFYSRLSQRSKALVDLLGAVIFLLPSAVFIVWVSWDYVSVAWRIRESSADPSGLPYVYFLKATIVVLAGLLIVQGSAEALKAIQKIRQSKS